LLKILVYGFPSLPLASLYFSIYVLLGEFYFDNYGLSLSIIGSTFIIIRLIDAFSDPIMGYISDNFISKYGKRKPWVIIGGTIFVFSTWFLFVPIFNSVGFNYFFFWLLMATIGWTVAYAPYYAMGAELSMDYLERSNVTFCRELFTILGIVIASLLYSISFDFEYNIFRNGISSKEGLIQICIFSSFAFLFSMIFFLFGHKDKKEFSNNKNNNFNIFEIFSSLQKQELMRKLLFSHFINGLANGLPPALFVFFVNSILKSPELTGFLLFLYFLGALMGVPLWVFLSSKYDKHRVWCCAMIYACFIFMFVLFLEEGDLTLFVVICIFSGLALSADLAIPSSIQADIIDLEFLKTGKRLTAQFFAFWGVVSKAAVALSTGIALILLDIVGFNSGDNNSTFVLFWLSFIYGGLPIILKIVSIYLMWDFKLDRKAHAEISLKLKN
jgi:GPH family glycoside/pentoside/hexuronide:cation symporter